MVTYAIKRSRVTGPGKRTLRCKMPCAQLVGFICLVGALAVGLGAPAVEGLAKWTQASEASTRGMATDIAGGGTDGGGGVKMVLCRDKCVSGCKVYRLPGL